MDKKTYINLLQEHKDRIFSHALYMLRNRQDAEDATQEVFVRLWKHRDSLDPKLCGGWLMRTAHNYCIDLLRHRKTKLKATQKPDDINYRTVSDFTGKSTDLIGQLEISQRHSELLAALDKLPDKTRSMMLLYYFQGQNLQTIGDMFGNKVGTIKVTLHRGRLKLKEILAPKPGVGKEAESYENLV